MTIGEILMDKRTNIITSLGTLVFVIAFAISATYAFTTLKTQIEVNMELQKTRLDQEIEDRKLEDAAMEEKLDETMAVMVETQTHLAEIKTDLKWIRAALEPRQ